MGEIITAFLGLAFVAFCLWLAVRIINRGELWAKRTAIIALLGSPVVIYVNGYYRLVEVEPFWHSWSAFHGRDTPPDKVLVWYGSRIGVYRFVSYSTLDAFFGPAHWLDKRLRPDVWDTRSYRYPNHFQPMPTRLAKQPLPLR
jgi:hypothetical protein